MDAQEHLKSIVSTVHEIEKLTAEVEAQVAALDSNAKEYLEAVHAEKQAGETNPALRFHCTKKAEMDAFAVRLRTAYQNITGIGNDLRRRAP